jgi:hypothetical protein
MAGGRPQGVEQTRAQVQRKHALNVSSIRSNMELDLQSLFGLVCTAVLIGCDDPRNSPTLPAFGLIY